MKKYGSQVMHEMGEPYSKMELSSFVTCSKGWAAECGFRSGYVELVRLDPHVQQGFSTSRGVMQCPNVLGQCLMDCVVSYCFVISNETYILLLFL